MPKARRRITRTLLRRELDLLAEQVELAWKRHEKSPQYGNEPLICPRVGIVGRCTDTAGYLASRLGGWVYGYSIDDNPTAEVGADEGGHDFAIVDTHWLLDFWAKDTYQLPDLYDMRDPVEWEEVRRRYGDPELWTRMADPNFKSLKEHNESFS